MNRRLLSLCLIVSLLCVVAVSAAAEEPVEVRFSFWGNFKALEFWKDIAHNFEKQNPDVRVKLEYVPGAYAQKLQLQLISNTAADIILMDDESYPGYAERGYLEDLTPLMERDKAELRHDFLPTALDSFTYKGVLAGMPWDGFPVMMFYSKSLFDEAGIPYPAEDWTWNDFREISKKLTKDTDGDGANDQFGSVVEFGFLGVEPVIWSFGGAILNEDRTAAACNTPQVYEAARFLQAMKFEDQSTVWSSNVEGMGKEVQLLTGRVGMVWSGWFLAMTLKEVKDALKWGVCQMPAGPTGERYTRVSWDGICINKYTTPDKKEIAWRFVKYLLSEEAQALVASSGKALPVYRHYAIKHFAEKPDPELPWLDKSLPIKALDFGRLTPITTKYDELKSAFQDNFKKLEIEDPSRRLTPEEVLPAAEKDVNYVLAKELEAFGKDKKNPREVSRIPYLIVGYGFVIAMAVLIIHLIRTKSKFIEETRMIFANRLSRHEALWGLLFAAPWFAGFGLLFAYPFYFSVILSFSEWDPYDPVSERTFVGLANFHRALFDDPLVWKALYNTFFYAGFAVPIILIGSLSLAMILNHKIPGIKIFRTVYYVPNIVGGVATSIMWMYIFNPVFGPLNTILRWINVLLDKTVVFAFINLPTPEWLSNPDWMKPAMILMMFWGTGGAGMLIFLAGLQSVPTQLYEAADLDGASKWQKFRNVTLPMLTPTIYFNLIMGLVGALQVFMQAYVMVGKTGGNDNALLFYVLYLYKKAFIDYEMGYASALAWILFIIIMAFTLLVVKSSAVWVYYEGEKRA